MVNFPREKIALPADKLPLAIVLNDGQILLAWVGRSEHADWVEALHEIAPLRSELADHEVLIRTSQNYFSATAYKCIKLSPAQNIGLERQLQFIEDLEAAATREKADSTLLS